MIKVLEPGLQTTVQDEGRVGYYEVGMPPSGAMDKYSHRIANLLVGNKPNAATLEITYMGPKLEFTQDAVIAVTGAIIPPSINGEEVPMWQTLAVKAGDILSFSFLKGGSRAYLAIAGGIDVPLVMGSRSTYTLCGFGGYEGRALQAGDELKIGTDHEQEMPIGSAVPEEYHLEFAKHHEIRFVIGLCNYRLTEESRQRFFEIDWQVTPEINRIGYRFGGERLEFVDREPPFGAGSDPANVVDLGYPIGSIQLPAGKEPIALMNDAVTGGGYVTIGTIISSDLIKLAQVKTGDTVRFINTSIDEAMAARSEINERLAAVTAALKQ